jgi:thiol-disulfide isomerase/thioredoxin
MMRDGQQVTGQECTGRGDERGGNYTDDPSKRAGEIGPRTGRRAFLAATVGLTITGAAGCTGDDGGSQNPTSTGEDGGAGSGDETSTTSEGSTDDRMDNTGTDDGTGQTEETQGGTPPGDVAAWRTMELTDVRSGETFTVQGLDGPVVLQSFAVWCPKCERQSNNMAGLDDSVTRVSLNTDPNEDASKVEDHAANNGFDWRFAVAPADLTEELKDEFGVSVTVAPSTPIIVACEGGGTMFDSGSILSTSEIASMADGC